MLFDRKIEPGCAYCSFSAALGADEIACVKRGIMNGYGSCGGFRYEPTKRMPRSLPDLKIRGLSEEDFVI